MKMTLDILLEFREHGSFLLVSKLMDCSLSKVFPFLFDLRPRFRLRLCLDLNVNRQWHTTVNKSPRSYTGAFAVKQDTFVDFLSNVTGWLLTLTSLSVFDYCFLVFGWICWESSPTAGTSEPNSFIQIPLKEIFGKSRGDAKTFSCLTSPVSIRIAFGIQ